MRIDNSVLQAGALIGVAALGVIAACQAQWGIVSACVTGFFAALSIHPKDQPPAAAAPTVAPAQAPTDPQP
jgi:hypothetical protein